MTDDTTAPAPDPAGDLVAALTSLTDPPKDGAVNAGQRRYRYLELTDLLAEVRAKMGAHNWAILQIPDVVDGHVVVTNLWIHASGEKITHPPFALPCGRSPQEIGSALTYARRYSLASLVGLAGADDDGQLAQQAAQQPRRSPQQDREHHGQTRPVQRATAAPDDPVNQQFQTPPDPGGAGAEVQGSPPRRPQALASPEDAEHTLTERPYAHHPSRRGASDRSIKMMWALLRGTGMNDDETRQWVAAMLGIDPDWHTNTLTQQQVSNVITALKAEQSEEPA